MKKIYFLLTIITISIFAKFSLFLSADFNLESDQSLTLLMSRRILEGRDFPFFYWGQNYMGMAEIWFSLPFQYIFGSNLRVFLVSQVALSIVISYLIYYSFLLIDKEEMGLIFSVLFSLGHPFLNKHLLNISENFGFSILIGILGFFYIYIFYSIDNSKKKSDIYLLFYGITLGFSLYNREILIFIFPFVLLLTYKYIKKNIYNFVILFFGIFIGYIPGIIHYLTVSYHKKLIRPTFKLNTEIVSKVNYFIFNILSEITISGEYLFKVLVISLSITGIIFLKKETNLLLKKYFIYYFLGVLTNIFVFFISTSYSVDRYYFYLTIGFLFLSSYSLSIIYKKNKKFFLFLMTLYIFLYMETYLKEFEVNLKNSEKTIQLKKVAEILIDKKFHYGIAEYWSAYTVQYFSNDTIHFLIYLDKQSDIFSTLKVLENKAEFFLFHRNSEFENYFLKNRRLNVKYDVIDIYDYRIYIPEFKTLDFLENSRDELLIEWGKYN